MHRIDGPGATIDEKFTEGNPATAVPATVVTDDWLNDVQEELISILAAAGISPVKGDQDQVLTAIQAIIAGSTLNTLDTTRIDVASAGTVNLTAAAPSTRHINITGTTTITGFTVAAGRCYFVRFAAALTLTSSASLVTQTGANIVTAAGDTCIIRATAENTVEVLAYTPSGGWGNSLAASGYQKLPSGLIIQWVLGSSVVATTQTINFPITFPTACLTVMSTGKAASGATGHPICGLVSFSSSSCVIKVFDVQNGASAVQPYIVAIGN